ncbi:MAG: tyrosine-type recombinase/integrase [Promethearchaeota archaeon]
MSNTYPNRRKKEYTKLMEFPETHYYIKDLNKDQNAYLSVLERYTRFTGLNPKKLIEEARHNIRDAKDRLLQFGDFLKAKGVSNRTIRQYLGSKLGRFFKYNMNPIIWTKVDWKLFPDQPINSKELKENGIKVQNIKLILMKVLKKIKNFRDKAIICSLFSSAMNLVDLLEITKRDWDQNYDKVTNTNIIIYKNSKTNKFETAFFSSESCSLVRDYFKFERREFESETEPIFLTFRKNRKEMEHQRPLDPYTFSHILISITSELGIEGLNQKSIRNFTINNLKKYNLDEEYFNYIILYPETIKNSNADFIKNFRKGCLEIEDLFIIGDISNRTSIKIYDLEKQIRELKSEIMDMKSDLKEIHATILILKTFITRLT